MIENPVRQDVGTLKIEEWGGGEGVHLARGLARWGGRSGSTWPAV